MGQAQGQTFYLQDTLGGPRRVTSWETLSFSFINRITVAQQGWVTFQSPKVTQKARGGAGT